MSELIVIFAACALSLFVAIPQATALYGRASGQRELDRLLGAVERAGADFLWQETRLLGVLFALITLAVSVPALIWQNARPLGITTVAASALALGAGAIAGGASARLAHWAAARATATSLAALRDAPETVEAQAFRGALLSALVADVLSTLLVLGVFLAHYGYLAWRLRMSHTGDPSALFLEATRSLPAAALGGSCAGAIFQMGGSNYYTSATIAAASARTHEHVARDEEQNPALVAELVGDSVGGVVSRSADAFSGLVLANCALLAIAALVARSNPALGRGTLGLFCLPLLVRALGSCASAVTASSVRFQAGLSAHQLFLGAGASHALMLLAGLFGATLWLVGASLATAFLACGALGILAGVLIRALLSIEARLAPGRILAAQASEASSMLGALGLGLQRTWWPLIILGACLAGAYAIGAHSPIARGGVLGLLLAIATLVGPGALYLCDSCFAAISETVHRIVGLRRGRFAPSARARSEELGQLGLLFGHWGQTQGVLAGAAAALLTALMLPSIPLASPLDGAIGIGHPVVILGGLTGAASLLFHLGSALQISGRAVSAVHGDVGERLEHETLEGAEPAALPSYRQSIQLAGTAATQSLLRLSSLALLAPVLFGVILRLVFGASAGWLAAQGLMAFASAAALTGCSAALAAEGSALALRTSRQSPRSEARGPAIDPSSAREFMGRSIGSSALIGLKATVIASLVIAPLLF